ncbi:MAG: hypothetical protein QNK27_07880 [Desulfuromusa sp.]|nr:hypothetical protein [Desulfuromusa sp.]
MRSHAGAWERVSSNFSRRLSARKVGYRLNVSEVLMKDGISPIINGKRE